MGNFFIVKESAQTATRVVFTREEDGRSNLLHRQVTNCWCLASACWTMLLIQYQIVLFYAGYSLINVLVMAFWVQLKLDPI